MVRGQFTFPLSLKGTVHLEMKIRPHAIQDVDEFVSSSEQIKRNLTGHHLQDIN